VRSPEGMTAYLVLKLSTEPFNDVVDEPTEDAVKQAWDMNGVAKVERPKTGQIQVCLARSVLKVRAHLPFPPFDGPLGCTVDYSNCFHVPER